MLAVAQCVQVRITWPSFTAVIEANQHSVSEAYMLKSRIFTLYLKLKDEWPAVQQAEQVEKKAL